MNVIDKKAVETVDTLLALWGGSFSKTRRAIRIVREHFAADGDTGSVEAIDRLMLVLSEKEALVEIARAQGMDS